MGRAQEEKEGLSAAIDVQVMEMSKLSTAMAQKDSAITSVKEDLHQSETLLGMANARVAAAEDRAAGLQQLLEDVRKQLRMEKERNERLKDEMDLITRIRRDADRELDPPAAAKPSQSPLRPNRAPVVSDVMPERCIILPVVVISGATIADTVRDGEKPWTVCGRFVDPNSF